MSLEKTVNDRFEHYVLGIPEIDNQHRKLSVEFKMLFDCLDEKDCGQCAVLATSLFADIVEHFKAEEIFMASIHFPYLDFHLGVHLQLIESLSRVLKSAVTKEVIGVLESAIYDHIEVYDRQIADFYLQ